MRSVSSSIDTASDEWRRICEARTYLRQGHTTADRVDALIERIEKARGRESAAELREEMRRQWKCRRDWMTGAGR